MKKVKKVKKTKKAKKIEASKEEVVDSLWELQDWIRDTAPLVDDDAGDIVFEPDVQKYLKAITDACLLLGGKLK